MAPLGLSVDEAAAGLGVTLFALSSVLDGLASISAALALRLEAAGWGIASGWLGMQAAYDLWQAKQQYGCQLGSVRRFSIWD